MLPPPPLNKLKLDDSFSNEHRKIMQINLEDLKYSQEKSQELAMLNKIKQRVLNETSAAARQHTLNGMKKYGSTSTLSTIVSESDNNNLSILSTNNLNSKNDTYNVNQSFKTVNTTFDCSMRLHESHLLQNSNSMNTSKFILANNSNRINENNGNSTFTVKTVPKLVAQDINQHKVSFLPF